MYLRLLLITLVPISISVGFYFLQKKTRFAKLPYWAQQAIIGVIFGGAAVFGTEFGVDVGGAIANARDSAPLCAGLLFGGPAGIIAGFIGGIERWFCVLWGGGMYSRLACSLSTALAGVYAALLRRYMFDNKRPTWGFGLAIGVVMEVIHMTILFLSHLSDAVQAYAIVKICTVPMVLCNSLTVMVSIVLISLFARKSTLDAPQYGKISQKVQSWLLVCVVLAYLATTGFVFVLQTNNASTDSTALLTLNLTDARAEITDASDNNLLSIAHSVAAAYLANPEATLTDLAEEQQIAEINIVSKAGIIEKSTNPDFVGFDMTSGKQSLPFMALTVGKDKEMVQPYQAIAYDDSIYRKYAGVSLEDGSFVQVGYDASTFQSDLAERIRSIAENRHIGSNGYIVVAGANSAIMGSGATSLQGEKTTAKTLSAAGIRLTEDLAENTLHQGVIFNRNCYWMYTRTEGFYILAAMPASDVLNTRDNTIYVNSFMEVLVFAVLFAFIYFLIKRLVVNNLRSVNESLSRIINGNLDEKVDVHASDEFASLSKDINSTVSTLKRYINEAAARIDKELAFAKSIQHSALPSVFPAYPNNQEFDIYASMDTAKEVGGDFYDFYMVDSTHLAFLMADVSGKGIPAAMFMMTAKTMLKNFAESGMAIDDVFTHANAQLCEGNEADMFVTGWMGILDITTGHVTFANAGHNPPVLYRKGEGCSYLKTRADLVLAMIDDFRYTLQELDLRPGDKIFLYTDGITEAVNCAEELYGEERLLSYLNSCPDATPQAMLKGVKTDVDAFAGEAEQFDDMTMLAVQYNGLEDAGLTERIFPADVDALPDVNDFVEGALEEAGCGMRETMQILVAMEEIFVNIAHYAYPDGKGEAAVGLSVRDNKCTLRFTDSGIPFNPLDKPDPDLSQNVQEKTIGGLGIYMVKKSMDCVTYSNRDGKNILTFVKSFIPE